MKTSDSIAKLAPQLVKALAKIEGAAKDSKNPHFKNDYASLESVILASRDVLAEHGLAVVQLPGALTGPVLTLETIILHDSGEYISGDFGIALGKQDPQGVGSALTYARRYALMAALNMPALDDDGEAASRPAPASKPEAVPTPHPEGPDFWGCSGPGMTAHAAKKAGLDLVHDKLRHAASEIPNRDALRTFCTEHQDTISQMPHSWRVELRAAVDERAGELGINPTDRRAA